MTVTAFYPDGPGSTVVDGHVRHVTALVSWTNLRTETGDNSDDSDVHFAVILTKAGGSNWTDCSRGIILFDTAGLGDGDEITAATLGLVVKSKTDTIGSQSIALVTSNPISNTALENADYLYTRFGTARQASDLTIDSLTADSSTANNFTLNAAGIASISKTSITKLGIRIVSECDNSEPSASSTNTATVQVASQEENLSGDRRPVLTVTHIPPFVPRMVIF
jgi:hypothetical protein